MGIIIQKSLLINLKSKYYNSILFTSPPYSDIFGLSISSGSLVNMVQSFADKAKGIYETIRERVARSAVVGADETGTCINSKNAWTWGFQTPQATFLYTIKSRAKAVIDQLFPKGFPQAVFVHDCWPAYFGVRVKGRQICTAHLLRELKYLHTTMVNGIYRLATSCVGIEKKHACAGRYQPL